MFMEDLGTFILQESLLVLYMKKNKMKIYGMFFDRKF